MTDVYSPSGEWDEREKAYDLLYAELKKLQLEVERYFRTINLSLAQLNKSTANLEWSIDEVLQVTIPNMMRNSNTARYKK